jgi:hypothetical protein
MTKTMGQIAYEASSTFLAREYLEDATPWDSELPGVKGLWEAAADAILEEAAKAADEWGSGKWRVKSDKRVRFSLQDMQTQTNTTGRGIAEDIRALKSTKEV